MVSKTIFISAIDVKSKFCMTLMYKHQNSENMTDFYNHFKSVYPGIIKTWQSDNGKENLGLFDQQLKKDNIPHYFYLSHCPKVDGFIERYNRTLQDDVIDPYLYLIHNKGVFGEKLTEYNIYYNSQKTPPLPQK